MELSKTEKSFLALVRSGLWEHPSEGLAAIDLSVPEWKSIVAEAESQTVSGLLWRGLDIAADEAVDIPFSLMPEVAAKADRSEKHFILMTKVATAIFSSFEKRGMHPVMLKGLSVSRLYAHPEFRESGDIDIYFPASELPSAVPAGRKPNADGSYDFTVSDVPVELHNHILDIERPRSRRRALELIDSYGFDTEFDYTTTAPQLTILLLNSHILKHAIGRGVGLRQICDYALARTVLGFDRARYDSDVALLGLGRWTRVLDCFCVRYLAMPYDGKSFSHKEIRLAERLLREVLSGGNFGFSARRGNGAWYTFWDFVGNLGFSMRLSAGETFWTIFSLTKGRLRR